MSWDSVLDSVRDQYVSGRIEIEEFEARVGRALEAADRPVVVKQGRPASSSGVSRVLKESYSAQPIRPRQDRDAVIRKFAEVQAQQRDVLEREFARRDVAQGRRDAEFVRMVIVVIGLVFVFVAVLGSLLYQL